MSPPKTLEQLIQPLPLELKTLIIHWAVRTDRIIPSPPPSAEWIDAFLKKEDIPFLFDTKSTVITSDPLRMFSANAELARIAFEEFWKVNVFQVISGSRYFADDAPFPKYPGKLVDDTSRRPYVQHLVLSVHAQSDFDRIEEDEADRVGIREVNSLWKLTKAYPKLQSLVVRIAYEVYEDLALGGQDPEPYRVIAWERRHYLRDVIRTIRELPGIKDKSLSWQHFDVDEPASIGQPVEIDGRGRELWDLVWEILEWPEVVVRLS